MAAEQQIGRSAPGKEAPRHVTGRGRFVDDLTLPRMLYAGVLRSPYGHARIGRVDAAKARALSGVRAVVTPEEIQRRLRPFKPGRYAAGLKVAVPEYAGAVSYAEGICPTAELMYRDRVIATTLIHAGMTQADVEDVALAVEKVAMGIADLRETRSDRSDT